MGVDASDGTTLTRPVNHAGPRVGPLDLADRLRRRRELAYTWDAARLEVAEWDGDADVMTWASSFADIYLQDNELTWTTAVPIDLWETSVVATRKARLADVNGDGCADIVAYAVPAGLEVIPATSEGCDGPPPQPEM